MIYAFFRIIVWFASYVLRLSITTILVRQELIIRWIINQQQVAVISDPLLERLELSILMKQKKSQGMLKIKLSTYEL